MSSPDAPVSGSANGDPRDLCSYELYIPVEFAAHVYDRIAEAGEEHGMVHAGLKALGSLRMEKGYRDYGHDMDNTDTLLEVGLGFTCDFEKEGGFIGKEAVRFPLLHPAAVSQPMLDPSPDSGAATSGRTRVTCRYSGAPARLRKGTEPHTHVCAQVRVDADLPSGASASIR